MRRCSPLKILLVVLAADCWVAGCGSSATSTNETQVVGADASADASGDVEGAKDGALEAGKDAGEAGLDASEDGFEPGVDAASEVGEGGVCTPGEVRCQYDNLQHCNSTATGWDSESCGTVALCEESLAAKATACVPPTCNVSALTCAADGKTLLECTPDENGWATRTVCPYSCQNGACWVPTPCAAGERRCGGSSGHSPETCNATGEWIATAACEGNTVCSAGECVAPPSCAGASETCGPDGNASCCATNLVPGGVTWQSYDPSIHFAMSEAKVSDFGLEVYEVSVARFRAFVEAGQGTQASPPAEGAGAHPKIAGSGWKSTWNSLLQADKASLVAHLWCGAASTWTDLPGANENKPINCVTWQLAHAFCAWDGGRLPTRAEWVYAAAGGAELRLFAWSNPPASPLLDTDHAVYCGNSCAGPQGVGSRSPLGDSRWGHADLTGNVAEWVLDSQNSQPIPCEDCAAVDDDPMKLTRGGSYKADEPWQLQVPMYAASPSEDTTIGFRCARPAK